MKLISLKRPKRKKRLRKNMVEPMDEAKYPWGLEIHIEDETVNKLGIDIANINAGDSVNLVCKAKITSVSRRQNLESGDNKTHDSLSLQITDMAYGVSMK